MSHPRLSLALSRDGAPSGALLVLAPPDATSLDDLPLQDAVIVQGFRPLHDALQARGLRVVPDPGDAGEGFAASVVFLPRSRDAARGLVAEAAKRTVPGGRVWVDGQKTDGIEAMIRELRARGPVSEPLAKAHGKLVWFAADAAFADWRAEDIHPAPGFVTCPGVFSADRADHGSALLAAALPDRLPARMADLGAGWGWLSAQILQRQGVEELHLVEADHLALDCARRNITDPRARFHWADATRFKGSAPFGGVVMNPPFHTGRAADPALGAAFIAAAAAMLGPSGRLWLVANRHLPYEAVLHRHFREVAETGGDGGFKLLVAGRPVPSARRER